MAILIRQIVIQDDGVYVDWMIRLQHLFVWHSFRWPTERKVRQGIETTGCHDTQSSPIRQSLWIPISISISICIHLSSTTNPPSLTICIENGIAQISSKDLGRLDALSRPFLAASPSIATFAWRSFVVLLMAICIIDWAHAPGIALI